MEFTHNKKTKKERREELNKIINSLDSKLENIEQMEKKKLPVIDNTFSNFEKIKEFHNCFSHPCPDTIQKEVVKKDPKLVQLRLELIDEEVKELHDAIKENNFTEVIDALSDILYVVYGAGAAFGIDLDKSFDIVHQSNMTKLAGSEQEAIETVKWYRAEFQKGAKPYDTPSYKKAPNGKWIIYNESSGKILKCIHYTPADFSKIL
jgi:predicted HAD superfamily Cof-like phosphohydrolase